MLNLVSREWQDQSSAMPFGWIGQTAGALSTRGVDVEAQLLALGVGGELGRLDPLTALTPTEYTLMCVRVINMVDDEMHGTTRSRMRRGTASLGLKLFGTGRTLGAAIESLFRFYDIAGGFCDARLGRDEATATIQIYADGQRSDLTAAVEEMMATHLHMIFSFYLGFFLPLGQFVTSSANHPQIGRRHGYLGAPTVAGGVTQLSFPASYLDLPSRAQLSDKDLVDAVMYWLSCFEPMDAQAGRPGMIGELGRAVLASLISEDQSFEQCCEAIGVGAYPLREALFAEGATYRQLRKIALIERVRPYLEVHASADDMAFGLGYSDARSLRRALKNATGLSLSEIRQPGPRVGPARGADLLRNLRREMEQMA